MAWTKYKKASDYPNQIYALVGKSQSTLHIPNYFFSTYQKAELVYFVDTLDKRRFGITYKITGEGDYKRRINSAARYAVFTLPQDIAKNFPQGKVIFNVHRENLSESALVEAESLYALSPAQNDTSDG